MNRRRHGLLLPRASPDRRRTTFSSTYCSRMLTLSPWHNRRRTTRAARTTKQNLDEANARSTRW